MNPIGMSQVATLHGLILTWPEQQEELSRPQPVDFALSSRLAGRGLFRRARYAETMERILFQQLFVSLAFMALSFVFKLMT